MGTGLKFALQFSDKVSYFGIRRGGGGGESGKGRGEGVGGHFEMLYAERGKGYTSICSTV